MILNDGIKVFGVQLMLHIFNFFNIVVINHCFISFDYSKREKKKNQILYVFRYDKKIKKVFSFLSIRNIDVSHVHIIDLSDACKRRKLYSRFKKKYFKTFKI